MSIKKIYKWLGFVSLPILSPGLTFFFGTQIPRTTGALRFTYIASGILSACLAPVLTRLAQRRDRRNAIIEIEAVISAVADEMGMLATRPAETAKRLTKIQERLITCAAQHANPKARSVFYALTADGKHLELAESHKVENAPDRFEKRYEDDLLHAINGKDIVYIRDNRHTEGNLRIDLGNKCRSAIVAPVYAGNEPQGVLVIDAPNPDQLTKKHVRESYVRAVARLLGTAHAMGNGAAGGRGTGVPQQAQGEQGGKANRIKGKES